MLAIPEAWSNEDLSCVQCDLQASLRHMISCYYLREIRHTTQHPESCGTHTYLVISHVDILLRIKLSYTRRFYDTPVLQGFGPGALITLRALALAREC